MTTASIPHFLFLSTCTSQLPHHSTAMGLEKVINKIQWSLFVLFIFSSKQHLTQLIISLP